MRCINTSQGIGVSKDGLVYLVENWLGYVLNLKSNVLFRLFFFYSPFFLILKSSIEEGLEILSTIYFMQYFLLNLRVFSKGAPRFPSLQ